ncbi:hypothetical protein BBW65_04965 [Helicobacter enhydrae]|uniref:DUF354 domain-containing protein n=1 Tax=Helicobacter enhydrae TaxID=222136 RepID=A0A1B1U5X2_9HELI|nr:DUF354 domain-containing protein [Helicobacter enhydrae]ANV98187.1 hypothetical protein BBW65_04965 [Helicobacter enhydrae]
MIWLDITDPKYVLFFKEMIPYLEGFDEVLITTRASDGYSECQRLLDLFGLHYYQVGGYGGADKLGKLQARLERQNGFLQLFERLQIRPSLFVCGASVEGVQTAYGLGIPVINFADTPIAGSAFELSKITILSRLTLPLSELVFHPFVVPKECYCALGLEAKRVLAYPFIDVVLWLKGMQAGEDFRTKMNLNPHKPTILVREEEYQAHYVKQKLPIIYESVRLLSRSLDVQIVIMPRYGSQELQKEFCGISNVHILEEKLEPNCFYPYIDLLIGGGGTMNLESCYLGIPTISTRSLFLFHDMYLIQNGLMWHAKTADEVLEYAKSSLKHWTPNQNRLDFQNQIFEKESAGFDGIVDTLYQRGYLG